jgi:hypothetical protein
VPLEGTEGFGTGGVEDVVCKEVVVGTAVLVDKELEVGTVILIDKELAVDEELVPTLLKLEEGGSMPPRLPSTTSMFCQDPELSLYLYSDAGE